MVAMGMQGPHQWKADDYVHIHCEIVTFCNGFFLMDAQRCDSHNAALHSNPGIGIELAHALFSRSQQRVQSSVAVRHS